ncbi:hypothetical protein MSAN_02448200 [Mycena sanguinolenta]|uniref:Uncharacterized protein n=1 Tax=Mycena sanguinolenta TaxID=230812 RepID=A0A8H7CBC2_9AGAR|nr:hypothetical protein MSAN_02448200 [Mycena sanguinolenta]
MLWSFLKLNSDSSEVRQYHTECMLIRWAFIERDPAKTYDDLVAARRLRDARLACSHAIACRRTAIRFSYLLPQWMEHRMYSPPAVYTPTSPPPIDSSSSSHGGWGTGQPWGSGGWETGGDWGEPWATNSASKGGSDPSWDGVTRVPKTPGKRKRQRRRKAMKCAEWAAQVAGWWDA